MIVRMINYFFQSPTSIVKEILHSGSIPLNSYPTFVCKTKDLIQSYETFKIGGVDVNMKFAMYYGYGIDFPVLNYSYIYSTLSYPDIDGL